jgi:hypothetical protein
VDLREKLDDLDKKETYHQVFSMKKVDYFSREFTTKIFQNVAIS